MGLFINNAQDPGLMFMISSSSAAISTGKQVVTKLLVLSWDIALLSPLFTWPYSWYGEKIVLGFTHLFKRRYLRLHWWKWEGLSNGYSHDMDWGDKILDLNFISYHELRYWFNLKERWDWDHPWDWDGKNSITQVSRVPSRLYRKGGRFQTRLQQIEFISRLG